MVENLIITIIGFIAVLGLLILGELLAKIFKWEQCLPKSGLSCIILTYTEKERDKMISKKHANAIASLIVELEMASSAVSRQCAKENPNGKVLNFWMNDKDSTILKLREVLGVKIQDTYAELREQNGS